MLVNHPNNTSTFKKLRKKYPVFNYESYHWVHYPADNTLKISYRFNISAKYYFYPEYFIELKDWSISGIDEGLINNIVFHIGMVEMISYWKATCSPTIFIKPHKLNSEHKRWWKSLFINGLGEFFHVNGISAKDSSLFSFSFDKGYRPMPRGFLLHHTDGLIVPIGGGKDSLASLLILKSHPGDKIAFAINPGNATRESVKIAGLQDQFFEVRRSIDPLLLDLNQKGFLNGHTPFSALLGFVSVLAAVITGHSQIVLSNESSANEPTIPGTDINHQYSKSYSFESDFRKYISMNVTSDVNYFSLLRPLNELQIASIFTSDKKFYSVFRSCNAGSKTNVWCCNCSKCLFTFIILAPFIPHHELVAIFGEDLFEKESLTGILDQLSGFSPEKPFECIGTINEVNSALGYLADKHHQEKLPVLLQHYQNRTAGIRFSSLKDQLGQWNGQHNLLPIYIDLVKKTLSKSQS